MDQDERSRTLADLVTSDIAVAESGQRIEDIPPSCFDAEWTVIIGKDRAIVGAVSKDWLEATVAGALITHRARTDPVILPATFEVHVLHSHEPHTWKLTDSAHVTTGLVVAVRDGTPVGVWDGHPEAQMIVTLSEQNEPVPPGIVNPLKPRSRGPWPRVAIQGPTIDATLGGDIHIGKFVRSCKYHEHGLPLKCGFSAAFSEKPSRMPACGNPRGLVSHAFVW